MPSFSLNIQYFRANTSKSTFLIIIPFALLFFPSITFNLFAAEVFPWATISFLLYIRKYNIGMLYVTLYLVISTLITVGVTSDIYEAIRSLAAYLNALLAFELILLLSDRYINQILVLTKYIFICLITLGFLQYLAIIDFLDPVMKFLVPRASSSSLSFIGRGVTLLSSEPARAGVELIFIYIVVKVVFIPKHLKYITDISAAFFLLFIVQSSMAFILYGIYIVFAYRSKLLIIIPLSLLLILFVGIDSGSGRSISLLLELKGQSSIGDALYILFNTSGHRIISIFSSYYYGVSTPFGGGVGNWMTSSIDALKLTGVDLSDMNYFKRYGDGGAVSIRASGYIANLMIDAGIIGTVLFFYYLRKRFKKFSIILNKNQEIVWLFIIKILFVGSVGTPVAFICVALVMRYLQIYEAHVKGGL